MFIDAAIVARLLADTSLTALIDDRLTPDILPVDDQGETLLPAVVYTTNNVEPVQSLDKGNTGRVHVEYQFDIWAVSAKQGEAIADLIRTRLDKYSGGNIEEITFVQQARNEDFDGYHAFQHYEIRATDDNVIPVSGGLARITANGDDLTFCGNLKDCSGNPLIGSSLPTQTGNANKVLTTNGTAASWTGAPTVSGANITSLNGSNISSGTVAIARLSGTVVRKDQANEFSTFSLTAASGQSANISGGAGEFGNAGNPLTLAGGPGEVGQDSAGGTLNLNGGTGAGTGAGGSVYINAGSGAIGGSVYVNSGTTQISGNGVFGGSLSVGGVITGDGSGISNVVAPAIPRTASLVERFTAGTATCFTDAGGSVHAADTDSVYVWSPTSGAVSNYTQSTSGKRPTLRLVGGKYYLRFDASDDGMSGGSSFSGSYTLFVSGAPGAQAGSNRRTLSAASINALLSLTNRQDVGRWYLSGSVGPLQPTPIGRILTAAIVVSSGGYAEAYLNGEYATQFTIASANWGTVAIGADGSSNSEVADADLRHFLGYSAALSSAEVRSLHLWAVDN